MRQVRLARCLSMGALAQLAGVPTSTISRIESGKIEPTMAMVARIAAAAGFRFEPGLAESGDDDAVASLVSKMLSAGPGEYERLWALMPDVAAVTPVSRRNGVRRVEVPGDLLQAVDILDKQGQEPIVSGFEAFSGEVDPMQSFIPLVYVQDPSTVTGFDSAGRSSYQVMLLLTATNNVRRFIRQGVGVPMMVPEWGLLDALASPGRQAEIAREVVTSRQVAAA